MIGWTSVRGMRSFCEEVGARFSFWCVAALEQEGVGAEEKAARCCFAGFARCALGGAGIVLAMVSIIWQQRAAAGNVWARG